MSSRRLQGIVKKSHRALQCILICITTAGVFHACRVPENIQDGQTAFKLKKYTLAEDLLQKEFNKAEDLAQKARIAFQIGECYQYNNQVSEAADWYNQAADLNYGSEAILNYAKMLKREEKYDDAITQYQNYLKEEPYMRPEITDEINSCKQALDWISRQQDVYERDMYITDLAMNSPDADFGPVLYKQDFLLFTSSRASATGDAHDEWTGTKYYDLYIAQINGPDKISNPDKFDGPFNTAYNDGSAAYDPDGSQIIFTRCGSENRKVDDYCGLYASYYDPDANWSDPVSIQFFEDTMNLGTPCFSPDGQMLFFSATNPDGYGGADIYFSMRNPDGWDTPQNAGTVINSQGNEVFPSFGPDGTFYFASDGRPGMGGLDIYSAKFKNGKFSNVQNMEYPINSGSDDFGLLMMDISKLKNPDTLEMGYFSSSRPGGKGSDDIYLFVKTKKKPKPPVFVLHALIAEKIHEDSLDVNSKVIDTLPLQGAMATVQINGAEGNPLLSLTVDSTGTFSMPVDSMKDYRITGSMDGYFNASEIVSTRNIKGIPGDTTEVFAEVVLDKKPTGKGTTAEIRLENIYYDLNDTTLRPESFPELDKLVKLLDENPDLIIQLNAHTDSRGSDSYNLRLSRGRANSVIAYLTAKGISLDRLVAKGWGESSPSVLADDITLKNGDVLKKGTVLTEALINKYKAKDKEDFEFLHQLNRRTTFSVIGSSMQINSDQNIREQQMQH